ncbi:sugar ABC transporter permease [Schaalia sp. ZJ405]|uniref:multiple monosaccharide ABC transporter permease n=1 Tax=unclassified Schaalia TaxID=2691889 RepID=UPI0013ECB9B0|nr:MULTISPECIES: multiple monosaccharide ABC transporter permease [unclassified Schaalia]QPK81283.1 sugar ABC transporter permease [Schaalia sp. ZJ405]
MSTQAVTEGATAPAEKSSWLKRIDFGQYGIMLALIAVVIFFQIMTGGRLLRPDNVASLIQQNAYVIIMAIGMLMIIIAGHIDLSVGSQIALIGGFLGVSMAKWDMPWVVAVIVALLIGIALGAWQGFWVAFVGIPGFIVTLAGMLLFRGLAIVIVPQTIAPLPKGFVSIANSGILGWLGFAGVYDVFTLIIGVVLAALFIVSQLRRRASLVKHGLTPEPMWLLIGKLVFVSLFVLGFMFILSGSAIGLPYVLVICAVLILVYTFVLNKTTFGRYIYAVGGNREAARLSGISVRSVNFWMFVNMGFLAAVGAIVTTSRAGAAVSAAGQNYELDVIAACFIGGAAVWGGIGRISGTIIGALFMGVLNMGLSIMSVDSAWQQAIKGLVLLFAVAFDQINKARATKTS